MATKFEDSLELFHDCGFHSPSRTILFFGDIDDTNTEKFIKNIIGLDSTAGDITVNLYSGGGDLDNCYAMYDVVRACQNEVTCRVIGMACSAATILLQAFDKRIITENSFLMLHKSSIELPDQKIDDAEVWMKKCKDDTLKFIKIYQEKIAQVNPITTKRLYTLLSNDLILSPKEALEWNLVDEIETKA